MVKDGSGRVVEVHCTYDPDSKGANPQGPRVKGTIHWLSAAHAAPAEVRLYETLFVSRQPDEAEDWKAQINPASLEVLANCFVEPALASPRPLDHVQFERTGYFTADPDTRPGHPVFNRTVSLRDTWAKIEKQDKS